MAKYLHLYESESAFNVEYNGNDYIEPWVSYTEETQGEEHVDYNKLPLKITVKVVHDEYDGQSLSIVVDMVIEYDDTDVPLNDLMAPVFELHDSGNRQINVVFYDFDGELRPNDMINENAFAEGSSCTQFTKGDIFYRVSPEDSPYDFTNERFKDTAMGTTISVRYGPPLC